MINPSGRAIAEAFTSHSEGAEDELNSAGLAIPTRIRCEGADPRDPKSPPLPVPTGDDIINIVVLLFEADLIDAFANEWKSFAGNLHSEADAHPERMLVLPVRLGDRSAIPPFAKIQSIPSSLFPGSGPSDPRWMRRLILTVVAHIGNFLRRLEQHENERDPKTPIDQILLSRFPLFSATPDGTASPSLRRSEIILPITTMASTPSSTPRIFPPASATKSNFLRR
jgi:hypothetical protein